MLSQPAHRRTACFLAAEGALYLAFLYGDVFRGGADTVLLKYGSIALCFAMSLLEACRGGERLMALGMALTLGADTFLLLLDRWYLAGVLLFFGVQLVYWARLARADGGRLRLGTRAVLTGALLRALALPGALTPLTGAAAVYLAQFLSNLLQCRRADAPWRGQFFWGLALYLACDLCVGLFQTPRLVPDWAQDPVRVGMWLFYLPGQVLLVLSGREKGEHGEKRE